MGAPFSLSVPFGGGIDRASGASSGAETDFTDLRNVALGEGRAELRLGLNRKQTFNALPSGGGITDIVEIAPVKSLGVGAAIAYAAATRVLSLWLLSGDGSSAQYVAVLWTLAAGAPFPRVFTADSFGLLFIAHDEQTFSLRQTTRVYDPIAGTVTDLTADLNTATAGAGPVKFRGVERWRDYLIGWGYGTEDDGDRPEIVRTSVAADPKNFLPNSYWIAGQRGDPVLRCARAGQNLLVHKPTESYRITGDSRANFGILPVDERYGIIGSHLSVSIGSMNYRWAVEGPRVSQGDASSDVALPLDIGGTLPDPAADPTVGDYAFAAYLPTKREMLFVFGLWAYVLHLKNPSALRWSYRTFGVEMTCVGELLDTGGSTLGSPLFPTITSVVP